MLGHGNTNNQLKFLSTILIRVKNLQSNACLLNYKTIGHLPNCNIRAAWTSYNLDEGNSQTDFFGGNVSNPTNVFDKKEEVLDEWEQNVGS